MVVDTVQYFEYTLQGLCFESAFVNRPDEQPCLKGADGLNQAEHKHSNAPPPATSMYLHRQKAQPAPRYKSRSVAFIPADCKIAWCRLLKLKQTLMNLKITS